MLVAELQADERYNFVGNKQQPTWEAELMDPASKFILARVQGARDKSLIHLVGFYFSSHIVMRVVKYAPISPTTGPSITQILSANS